MTRKTEVVLTATEAQVAGLSEEEKGRVLRGQDLTRRLSGVIRDGDSPSEVAGALITVLAGITKGYGGETALEDVVGHLRRVYAAVVVSKADDPKYPDGERPIEALGLGTGRPGGSS